MSEATKQLLINIGITLWVSFLSAGVASIMFFSTFDPSALAEVATYPKPLDPSAGYSLGFLLFWVLLIFNSLTVLWLAQRRIN